MLDPRCIETIEQTTRASSERVLVVHWGGAPLVVKALRPRRSPFRYRALSVAARLLGIPWAQGVPAHGGTRAQAIEVARLRALRQAGVRVPALLHEADRFLVLEFIGPESLRQRLKGDPERALRPWLAGLHAIAELHRKNQYASQAFARNLLYRDEQLWFVDFEDDPLEAMTLAQAQTRDWLIYLFSTLRYLAMPLDALVDHWHPVVASQPQPEREDLLLQAGKLRWLRHLPKAMHWGEDVRALRALGIFLQAWCARNGITRSQPRAHQ